MGKVDYIFDCGCDEAIVKRGATRKVCAKHGNNFVRREYVCKHGTRIITKSLTGPVKKHCDKCKKEKIKENAKRKADQFKKETEFVRCICPGTEDRDCGEIHYKKILSPDCKVPRVLCDTCKAIYTAKKSRLKEYYEKRDEIIRTNRYLRIDPLYISRLEMLEFDEFEIEYGEHAKKRKKLVDFIIKLCENRKIKKRAAYA